MQPLLTNKEKLAYGLGDTAANLIFQTQITFLMFFYTDVFGIQAADAGIIVLVSRILDAVTDPIIGAIADRTNSRWGRYRPWIAISAIPLAAALVLCYSSPDFGRVGKVVWAAATYNLLMVLYAANNIPYAALSGVMTTDSVERTSLASWRFVCAMSAALVVNTFTVKLVATLGHGDPRIGYPATMAIWACLAVIFFFCTFAFTRERIAPDPLQRSSVLQDLADLRHNRPWLALFTLAVLIHVQLAMRGGAMLYYFQHYLTSPDLLPWIDNFGLFNGVGLIFTVIGVVLAKPLVLRFGKRATFRACLFLSSLLMAAFVFVPPDSPAFLFALQCVLQLVFGPTIPILWSMMADVADYSEWTTGRRSTALAFASIIFGLKMGLGVGAWFNGHLLQGLDYSAAGQISDAAQLGFVRMISLFPAAVLMLGVAALFGYGLDDSYMRQVEDDLASRREQLENETPKALHPQ
jgi:GPH family glycoside/pentoside/hexuronide:cation symporter